MRSANALAMLPCDQRWSGFASRHDNPPDQWGIRREQDYALNGSTASWLFRQADGRTIAIIINTLPTDFATFFGEPLPPLQQTAADVSAWPTVDLWS
jgi:hypothetical protein